MTVQYKMADGNVVDVEASSEVAELLAAYERQDQANGGKGDITSWLEAISESYAWQTDRRSR